MPRWTFTVTILVLKKDIRRINRVSLVRNRL